MAYTITKTDGTTKGTIVDGTVNTAATSLTLIGKNYAGYGNFLNENFVKLLENFSYGTAPSNPLPGQLWYDNTNRILKLSTNGGNEWKSIASLTAQTTEPISPAPIVGDQWWDSNNAQLKVWSGPTNRWVTVGPSYTTTGGTSGSVVETINDSNGNSQIVVKMYIQGTPIGIISGNATPYQPQTTISGFTTIYPGFNLISSTALTGSRFTGDVSNALTLNGVASTQFLRSDVATTTNYQLGVANLQVGSDLLISPTSSTEIKFSSFSAAKKDIGIYVNAGATKAIGINGTNAAVTLSGTITASAALNVGGALAVTGAASLGAVTISNTLLPSAANTINIGASGTKFANVHAVNVNGTTVAATTMTTATLTASGNVRVASLGVGVGATGITGNIVATGIITQSYSDDALKTRIGLIDHALDKVDQLSGFYYQANELAQSLGYTTGTEVGVSAQETQAVMPEIVAPAPIDDKYLTVRYERFAPLLIEAIKELRKEVNAIKIDVNNLKNK